MLRNVEDLRGPAGRLEALLNEGQPDAPYAALVCHPHPMYGGTMHNKVVYHAMKTLQEHGLPVLRFNFRGAGLSEGEHDRGHGETEDVRAALAWLGRVYAKPILFAGFSFGASVGLHACCGDARVHGLVGLGFLSSPVAARTTTAFSPTALSPSCSSAETTTSTDPSPRSKERWPARHRPLS